MSAIKTISTKKFVPYKTWRISLVNILWLVKIIKSPKDIPLNYLCVLYLHWVRGCSYHLTTQKSIKLNDNWSRIQIWLPPTEKLSGWSIGILPSTLVPWCVWMRISVEYYLIFHFIPMSCWLEVHLGFSNMGVYWFFFGKCLCRVYPSRRLFSIRYALECVSLMKYCIQWAFSKQGYSNCN